VSLEEMMRDGDKARSKKVARRDAEDGEARYRDTREGVSLSRELRSSRLTVVT
jgi:hypothetical protein